MWKISEIIWSNKNYTGVGIWRQPSIQLHDIVENPHLIYFCFLSNDIRDLMRHPINVFPSVKFFE